MTEAYLIHLLVLIGIYSILAVSLQFSIGYGGMLNLAHISFFGIGAYVSALLVQNDINFLLAFILSGISSMMFGFLIVLFVKNLKGDYLAIATIGFSFIVYAILVNWIQVTHGPFGIVTTVKLNIFSWIIDSKKDFLIFVWLLLIVVYGFIFRIVNSPFGKIIEAVRDNEFLVSSLGKNILKIKSITIGISAFVAGLTGSIYAHYIAFINPDSFSVLQMGQLLSIVIMGGLASLRGTFLATVIVILLPEVLRFIGFDASTIGPIRQIFYSVIILIILILKPKGFWGKVTLK